ncbi:MAG TPA: glycoside hydrolase family 9 protein [Verrucomicrobiae bacterium]|nr:glycoside hydrolase family 9 protein [Verrucomicrobiae bacterium]
MNTCLDVPQFGTIFIRWCLLAVLSIVPVRVLAINETFANLQMPAIGDHALEILSPTVLEMVRVNTKPPGLAPVQNWNWINDADEFAPPDLSSIRVIVDGITNTVSTVGFKRRPIYAPLNNWDLRIANHLYLVLMHPVNPGQVVQVVNDGTLWPTNLSFFATAHPLRLNPAIHVNHEGYLPALPKKAMVGYAAGNLGELMIPTNRFQIISTATGLPVFDGSLQQRPEIGFTYSPAPYQQVYEADFGSFSTPGEYRLAVPGMGASLPFRISEGFGMLLARTYALGMFHQRSGFDVSMPFTRFTHAADHTAPAAVATNASGPFTFTWNTIADYASFTNFDNPPQLAPRLTSPAAQLYPFVNPGPVDVSGGHFEAANYSKPGWNSAQLIHIMMFAVDALPGVASLDNLGIPESGDGISDVLQEAKWEADFLVKMQDADGGFYYMIHPQEREYEFDVLPEHGDPQVVWPKNTATTAAAVAALVQCASSPRFKAAYPQASSNYFLSAQRGWRFLTNALAVHGEEGAYQRIMHFDDAFTDRDDLAWAACELFLATGDPDYHTILKARFPDPLDPSTMRWGWWKMYAAYGNAVRSYAAAVRSGRLQTHQIDLAYHAKCIEAIADCAEDNLRWSHEHAYGSSFPEINKTIRKAGWYYSTEQAFDIVVAHEFAPQSDYLDAILLNINFETGCNPVNVSYLTGIGWKRQREVVDQYSANDHRVLPKIGVPIGNIQEGFVWTWLYGGELSALTWPSDGLESGPYPFYDRWADFWNVSTEASTANTVRSFAVAAWLAAKTALTNQPWRSTNAALSVSSIATPPGRPVTVTLQVADTNLTGTKIIWEARGAEPTFGDTTFTFTPGEQEGLHWIEAEVQWPDGRRAFAMNSILVSTNAPPALSAISDGPGGFRFQITGAPWATYWIQASTNLSHWETVATNTLPAVGLLDITAGPADRAQRFFRAVKPN